MRTEQEIFDEYDQKIKEIIIGEDENYVHEIRKMIQKEIERCKPRYSNGELMCVNTIYLPYRDYYMEDEEWYNEVYHAFVNELDDYDLTDLEVEKIKEILKKEFSLDKFLSLSEKSREAEDESYYLKERLLDEYSLIPDKDMKEILSTYIRSHNGRDIIHPLLYSYVNERCEVKLTQKK